MRFAGTLVFANAPLLATAALFAVAACGCSSDEGPTRYRISGEVLFDGKPIPHGDILFTPDGSLGNSGAQGIATIENGRYDTSSGTGQGMAGGPTVIRVTGLDAADGTKLLCEYEYKADLPRQDSTFKVEVPASAAHKKPASPEI